MRDSWGVRVDQEPGAATRGTERWLVGAAGLLRLVQMMPWLAVVATGRWHSYHSPGLVAVLYIGYACWAVLLFGTGRRRLGFSRRWAVADVAINACCLVTVGSLCAPGYATSFQNWTLGPAMGAAILTVIWRGWSAGMVAAGVLSVAYALGARSDMTAVKAAAGTVTGNVVSLVAFTVAAGLVAIRLRSTARQTDLAAAVAGSAWICVNAARWTRPFSGLSSVR